MHHRQQRLSFVEIHPMTYRQLSLLLFFALMGLLYSCNQGKSFLIESDGTKLTVEEVSNGISVPFGMAFLPHGKMLVTDRPNGKIILLDINSGEKNFLEKVPEVLGGADGGMLDVAVHPDFATNGWIYFSYAILKDSTSTMVVDRAKLDGLRLIDRERLFTALPYYKEPNHFGSRLLIQKGYLYVTMGERYYLRDSAQSLNNHLGKIMRLYDDGRVPLDNPFVKSKNALPEIWSYGHRNPQGLVFHEQTQEIWEHEHGPKGGDEINIIRPGLNYGWPVICYGIDYDGMPIGDGITEKDGMEQPLYHYTPSIAPSGMDFYTSDVIPAWKGNLFIGAMALKHLNRLVIRGNKVLKEERLLLEENWRIRCVKQGPDGYLYFSIDGGKIFRIRPATLNE